LYEVGGRKAYYPTGRWLVKARAIAHADPVAERVQPFLQQLRDAVGETALLGKRMGDQVIHLGVVESFQSIRYSGQPGDLKSLHATASGKALLGSMPLAERRKIVARLNLLRGTSNTVTTRKQLLLDIEEGAKRGWWSTREGNIADAMAIAAPLELSGEVYAIVIAGLSSRMQPALASHAKKLLATCRKVAQTL
jgi:DNA-binding IclR family transcriptional regulator